MELNHLNPVILPGNIVTHFVKIYPDRQKVVTYKTPYSNFQGSESKKKTGRVWLLDDDEKLDYLAGSLQRSKTRISDLTICKQFDMFVTFTINCRACMPKCNNKPCICDQKTCQRFDLEYCIRTQKAWYNNQIKRYGRFPYLQVMELHKNGGYHFHALFKDYPGKLNFWKTDKKDGRPIYSLSSNKKGWTTVKRIYDISGTSSYIRKYITKDMPLYPGKKRYWASQGLRRVIIVQDDELMAKILANPKTELWSPTSSPTLRENGTLRPNNSNVKMIATLLLDNESDYSKQLEKLRLLKAVASVFGLDKHALAHTSVQGHSQARGLHSLTVDSPKPTKRSR